MGFATKWKTKKICAKEWSKKHIFLSHFFIFHHKPKRMLKFLRNGFWIVIVQKIRKKGLSHSGKMHFSVSGHVTLGVVRWRHELDYICPLWVLSKFRPIEAYMCWVIASWFFPSNGIKRYFNGPLSSSKYVSNVSLVLSLSRVLLCYYFFCPLVSCPFRAKRKHLLCLLTLLYLFCCRFWCTDDFTQWTQHNWKASQVFRPFLL